MFCDQRWPLLAKPSTKSHHCPTNDNLQVIAAEGEQKASRALKEASDIISESPAALQLRSWFKTCDRLLEKVAWAHIQISLTYITPIFYRYLQTLSTISTEKNSTIVFPIPIEMFSKFIKQDWSFVLGVWKLYLLHFYIIYTLHEPRFTENNYFS